VRTLQWHCSRFSFEAVKKTPVAEGGGDKMGEYENALVCFICYEKKDEGRNKEIVKEFVSNLKVDFHRIKPEIVDLYPYAHLRKRLGSPKMALEFLNDLFSAAESEGISVVRSPFGWYKKFEVSCKGHPLAEAYREY
jgi:threonyl-tRNA synthetase